MTIASHCLALLHDQGPLTAEELGAACHDAGVTMSKNPVQAVINALRWNNDGRAMLIGDRFHAVTQLLEGRWLTFPVPDELADLMPEVDLACLTGVVRGEGLPLASGGTVTAGRYGWRTWKGPEGWLPTGETLGLRLSGGTAQLIAVEIDDAAKERGVRLLELLTGGEPDRTYDYFERTDAAGKRLLTLLYEHDDLLREPAPPLSLLLPTRPEELPHYLRDPPPPFWPSVQVHLTPELHQHLELMASFMGKPLGRWLSEQLEWLAECPTLMQMRPYSPYGDIHEARERYAEDPADDSA